MYVALGADVELMVFDGMGTNRLHRKLRDTIKKGGAV